MRKKVIASLLTATAVVGMLAGCGGSSDSGSDTAASGEEGKHVWKQFIRRLKVHLMMER